jgi:signal transduction histidine kinase
MESLFPSFPSLEELKKMMRLASSRATWIVFVVPLFLLLAIGVVADRTTTSFAQSERWVSHTHEVQTVIQTLRADAFMAQDSRKAYVLTSDDASLAGYAAGAQQLPALMKELKQLTADNTGQQARIDRLEKVIQGKLAVLQGSIDLRKAGSADAARQAEFTAENEDLTAQMSTILTAMLDEENRLLAQRVVVSADTYRRMRMVLAIAFVAVLFFLLMTFGRLLVELRNRMRAEAAVRRLSGRILQLQDVERRKVARELHDGVGQFFASSKMAVDVILHEDSLSAAQRKALTEASDLLEQGIAEARTLSHLLHPPLLDELGFRAAAEWYINGFSERSKVKVQFTSPANLELMSKEIELVLFRVLQEALTNIHRHAASATAEVRIYCVSGRVSMEVEDQGKGISRTLLDDFRRSTGTGVGLAGMRERVSEFQGTLEIMSHGRGTLLKIEMPLPAEESAPATVSGPPNVETQMQVSTQARGNAGNGLLLAASLP